MWRVTLVALVAGLAIINATGVYAQLVAAHVGSRASSGSAERLWSKDQAASRLNRRRRVGRLPARGSMRPKLVTVPSRFQSVVAGARMLFDAAGGSLRN